MASAAKLFTNSIYQKHYLLTYTKHLQKIVHQGNCKISQCLSLYSMVNLDKKLKRKQDWNDVQYFRNNEFIRERIQPIRWGFL